MPVSQIPARELDISREDHVRRIILEVDNEENRKRRRASWIANQCLEGNQKEYVEARLAILYPETFGKFRVGDISIVKKVNDKQSKAYKNAPIRKCETDKETDSLTDIYKRYHFHKTLKEFDSVFNLNKYAGLWLTWQNPEERDDDEGRYILHALAPYEFDIVRDQVSGEPIIFILNYPDTNITRQAGASDGQEQTIAESQSDTSARSRIYSMWSKDTFVKVQVTRSAGHGNQTEEKISINFLEEKTNELGRLPLIYVQKDSAIDYPIDSNLAEQSIEWNVSFSDLKTAAATQGHGQLVLSHPEGKTIKQLHMGMHTAISLPQSKKETDKPTTAEYISASPDLAGQLEVLKFDVSNILDDQGIKAKGTIEGGAEKFSSGFDRLLSEADVQDLIEDNQTTYADELEPELFDCLKAYEEAMNQTTFAKTDMIEVHFEKPKVLISDKETLDNIAKREELGLMLPHEKHMIMNPNLTEEQAKEREAAIQEFKKQQIKEMADAMGVEEEPFQDPKEDEK
jgi:hypothetical protein